MSHPAYESFKALTFAPSRGPRLARGWWAWVVIPAVLTLVFGYGFKELQRDNQHRAQIQYQQAQAAFQQKRFALAAHKWEDARECYGRSGDVEGEMTVLLALGRCYSALGQADRAKQNLRQASRLLPTDESSEALNEVRRVFAARRLADSVALQKAADFGNGFLAAVDARSAFEEGSGSPVQLAEADLAAARTSLHLGNLDAARRYLQSAKTLVPESAAGKALWASLVTMRAQSTGGEPVPRSRSKTIPPRGTLERKSTGKPRSYDRPTFHVPAPYPTYQKPKKKKKRVD